MLRMLGAAILVLSACTPVGSIGCTYNTKVEITQATDEVAPSQLYLQADLPTVKVNGETGTGSGVLFNDGKFCLTAAHVVLKHEQDDTDEDGKPVEPKELQVEKVFITKKLPSIEYTSRCEVVKIDKKLDLAVLKLQDPLFSALGTSSFATHDPIQFQRCWSSGYPFGIMDVTVCDGRIQDIDLDGGFRYSCPTTFGNSGGPIFVLEGKRLVVTSICQRVIAHFGGASTPHLGFGASRRVIVDFTLEFYLSPKEG